VSVVVIDNGCEVDTVGDVEAYLLFNNTGKLELYFSPTEKVTVDTHRNKVTFKKGSICVGVYRKGVFYAKYKNVFL